MTAAVYYTLFAVSVIAICKAQLLPGGVPLFLGQPHNQNTNAAPNLPLSQKFFTQGKLIMPALAGRVALPSSSQRLVYSVDPTATHVSTIQQRSADAEDQKTANPEEKAAEQSKHFVGKTPDSMDPVDQETDDVAKEVLGSSGSFSDGTSSTQPKVRSSGSGDSIPELDSLVGAANPIVDFEKKVEKTAKNIAKEIKYTFKKIPQLFQGRTAEGGQNEEVPRVYQPDSEKPSLMSPGLRMAMDAFQKKMMESRMMHAQNQGTNNYGNQYNPNVYSNENQAGRAKTLWDTALSAAKNVADSSTKGGQPTTTSSTQENDPISKILNSAVNAATNFAESSKNLDETNQDVSGSQQNQIPDDLWQTVARYVAQYTANSANSANTQQPLNNQYIGGSNRGYGNGGYPTYYGNGYHGHHDDHDHHYHHDHHDHHGHNGYGSYNPYYPGAYYPKPGYQYGGGYYKRSPVEGDVSTVSRNSRGIYLDDAATEDVRESVFDLVRSIMDGNPHEIAHAGVNMGSEIADATTDSDLYKRSNLEETESSTSARNSRQMPWSQAGMLQGQAGGITKSALMLAQGILARQPGQIANAGVNMGSGIAGAATTGQRFVKRSDPAEADDSELSRSPRQMLPILPLPGLMQPVQTGLTSTALNFAQGFVGANPNKGIIQPIVGGMGTSAGNLAQELGFMQRPSNPIQGLPMNQFGQIAGSAVNLAQAIMANNPDQITNAGVRMGTGIVGAANQAATQSPRFFKRSHTAVETVEEPADDTVSSAVEIAKSILNGNAGINTNAAASTLSKRSDSMEPQDATLTRTLRQMPPWPQGWGQSAGGITTSALGLAQAIVNGNPSQIANSGVNMGTGIVGTANPAGFPVPRFFKRSHLTEAEIDASGQDQTEASVRTLRQPPQWPQQGWIQPAGGITNSALNLAQGIWSGNPGQITNSGVNMGTGIASIPNTDGFIGQRFFKRSPQGGIWQSATGLAGSIADSAAVDPSRLGTQQVMGTAGTIWKAANNLFGNLGKIVITPISSDQIVGTTKDGSGGSVLPSDLLWESISDLAGNIAKVNERPSILGKALTTSNSADKVIVKLPGQGAAGSQILGAMKPEGEIANSATTLASRIASLLLNPNIFNNPNLDSTDYKPSNPVLNPIYMAGDIVGAALKPGVHRHVRMLESSTPTHQGSYVLRSIPAVPTYA